MTFTEFLQLLLKKWWIMILGTIICGSSVFAYTTLFIKPKYSSDAKMYINFVSETVEKPSDMLNDISFSSKLANTCIQLLQARGFREALKIELVNSEYGYGKDLPVFSMTVRSTGLDKTASPFIAVTVTAYSSEDAFKIAKAYVKVAPIYIEENMSVSSNNLEGEPSSKGFQGLTAKHVKIIEPPLNVVNKVSPNRTLLTLMGIIAGAVLSILLILVLDVIDNKVKEKEKLSEKLKVIVIGEIPAVSTRK